MMAEGMINRIGAALSPHLGPGSSNGDQIARLVLAVMREPTEAPSSIVAHMTRGDPLSDVLPMGASPR